MGFKHGIYVAEVLLAFLLVQPLGSFFWRGTWEIWGHYVKFDCVDGPPVNSSSSPSYATGEGVRMRRTISPMAEPCADVTGAWVTGIIGCLAMTLFNCVAPLLQKHVTPDKVTMPGYVIITRIYFLLFGFAYFGHWRGVWGLTDHYAGDAGKPWRASLIGLGATYGLTILLRTSKMAMSSPWHCGSDLEDDLFMPRGWFRSTPKTHGVWFFCLDQFLSQLIPLSLSIIVWRCFWNILDDTFLTSMVETHRLGISVGIGVCGQLVCILLSFPASRLSRRLDREPLIFKLIWEDFFYVLVNGTVVFVWYGMWGLVAKNIMPDTERGSWLSLGVGYGGLALLCNTRSAFDNSVDFDGEDVNGEGVQPLMYFFQHWFRERLEAEQGKEAKIQPELTSVTTKKEENGNSQAFTNTAFVTTDNTDKQNI